MKQFIAIAAIGYIIYKATTQTKTANLSVGQTLQADFGVIGDTVNNVGSWFTRNLPATSGDAATGG